MNSILPKHEERRLIINFYYADEAEWVEYISDLKDVYKLSRDDLQVIIKELGLLETW